MIEEQHRTVDTPASPLSGANVTLMIGALLAAALIAVAVAVLVRHLRSRSTPVVTPPTAATQAETAMNATEILARMRIAYASLATYQDSGLVIEREVSTDVRHHTRGVFSTKYRKPHSLAFYFNPIVEHEIQEWYWVVRDGDRFESHRSGVPTGHSSVFTALASLTDKSLGATLCALPLLINVPDLERLDGLRKPAHVGIGHVEGNACYKIRGELGARSIVLWIDQEHSLIRQVEFDDGRFMIIITPETHLAIPSDAFTTPPTGVSLPRSRR